MAEFMNEQLTTSNRRRKSTTTATSHLELDLQATSSTTTTTTNRTEAELAQLAAELTHVPRDQWPDNVLTFQREQQRVKKRKDREMQAEDDRLRREVEQKRRQEQLAKMAVDEPEEKSRRCWSSLVVVTLQSLSTNDSRVRYSDERERDRFVSLIRSY